MYYFDSPLTASVLQAWACKLKRNFDSPGYKCGHWMVFELPHPYISNEKVMKINIIDVDFEIWRFSDFQIITRLDRICHQ